MLMMMMVVVVVMLRCVYGRWSQLPLVGFLCHGLSSRGLGLGLSLGLRLGWALLVCPAKTQIKAGTIAVNYCRCDSEGWDEMG